MSFPSFRIGTTAQNKNPEAPGILNSLNTLNFICQPPKDSTCISQNNDFKTLNPSQTKINQHLSANLPHNLYCFLLIKSLTRFNFLGKLKLNDQFWLMSKISQSFICSWNEIAKFSVDSAFSSWLYNSKQKPETPEMFKSLKILNFSLPSSHRLYLNMTDKWF